MNKTWAIVVAYIVLVQISVAQAAPPEPRVVKDIWTEPNPGLQYLVRVTDVPCRIHVLVADLTVPGVRILTTPHEERWQTVREFAHHHRLAAATNGGFWGKMMRAWGVSAGNHKRWPDGEDDNEIGFFAVGADNRAWISPPARVENNLPAERVYEAVSGMPQLVKQGAVDEASLDAFPYSKVRHPRSAVGVSQDGSKVVLIVASGRQSHSRGMSLIELAKLFIELGAYDALNLDGGGSSTMYVAREGGIVNAPSGGRWVARLGLGAKEIKRASKFRESDTGQEEAFVRGVEREVMNHIGVMAPSQFQSSELPVAKDTKLVVAQPTPPWLRLGQLREWLVPGVLLLGVMSLLTLGWLLSKRWRK